MDDISIDGISLRSRYSIAMHNNGRKAVRARRLKRLSVDVNRLLKEQSYTAARTQLVKIMKLAPSKKRYKCMFAWTYAQQGNFDQAIEVFRMLVQAFPDYEWASLGLFHSLWEKGFNDEAFEEMKRFTRAGGDSQNYRDIVNEINSKGTGAAVRSVAHSSDASRSAEPEAGQSRSNQD